MLGNGGGGDQKGLAGVLACMQGSQGSGCCRCRRGEPLQNVGDVDVYGIAWINKEKGGEIRVLLASSRARGREQRDGEVGCNLHPRRRRSTPQVLLSGDGFFLSRRWRGPLVEWEERRSK
jgi:hypothetical protein